MPSGNYDLHKKHGYPLYCVIEISNFIIVHITGNVNQRPSVIIA